MQVVYNVRFRIHPILRLVFRVFKFCTLLILIGAVLFTTVGLIRNRRQPHPPAHPMTRVRPIIVPYK